jgi:prepilin-type N-terminal cleavage/methylation domain-containing protein
VLKSKKKQNSNSGFSLLEVLVTLFFIGLILVLYQSALGKLRLIRYVENEEIALRVASNKIENLRAGGYDALPSSGSFSDSQLNALSSSSANMTITDFNATTKTVVITIEWQQPPSMSVKNVSLTTLITKTGGL